MVKCIGKTAYYADLLAIPNVHLQVKKLWEGMVKNTAHLKPTLIGIEQEHPASPNTGSILSTQSSSTGNTYNT